ncbi:MAG: DNA polymerase III subunit gamma/tau [Planctomycetota bacterium]|nr:DNA polymerase III subunit gamma/tau [Planctomycetota bacterium]
MSYTVLARRYRSRDFDEVVGQEPIARTLRNAIESDRVAHAYLFCGTRGVGKTTMARLFARALNISDDLVEADAIAEAIMSGSDLDVIEIDGASNRGVQEARDLIASASLKPARCRYRIYIIDEVHMLTRDAFNALLKTMEEPPEHVKFILCTTEPNDVLQTIQSRCQRFDFRAIPARQIADHLASILEQEGIEADPDALLQVARLGEGSMRDALSILDRLLAAGPERLTSEFVSTMLGLPARALVETLLDATLDGDAAAALAAGERLLQEGVTINQAIESMTDSLRSLLVATSCGADTDLLQLSEEQRARVRARCDSLDADAVLHMIARCEATARHARFTASSRALFDALLVRLASTERLADISSMLRGTSAATVPAKKKTEGLNSGVAAASSSIPPKPPAAKESSAGSSAPPAAGSPAPVEPVTPENPVVAVLSMDSLWDRVCSEVESNVSQALLQTARPVSWDGEVLVLEPRDAASGSGNYLRSQSESIAGMVRSVAGRHARVKVESSEPPQHMEPAVDPLYEQHPDVMKVMEIFDAVVVSVEPVKTGEAVPCSED